MFILSVQLPMSPNIFLQFNSLVWYFCHELCTEHGSIILKWGELVSLNTTNCYIVIRGKITFVAIQSNETFAKKFITICKYQTGRDLMFRVTVKIKFHRLRIPIENTLVKWNPHPSISERQCILGRPNGVMGHDEAVTASQSFYLLDRDGGVTQGATNSEFTNLTY